MKIALGLVDSRADHHTVLLEVQLESKEFQYLKLLKIQEYLAEEI